MRPPHRSPIRQMPADLRTWRWSALPAVRRGVGHGVNRRSRSRWPWRWRRGTPAQCAGCGARAPGGRPAGRCSSPSGSPHCCGRPAVSPAPTSTTLFWVWTAQQLALLLVVPYLILAGQPLQLARAVSGEQGAGRFLRSAGRARSAIRWSVRRWSRAVGRVVLRSACRAGRSGSGVGWFEQLVVLGVGALIVLPLVGADGRAQLARGRAVAGHRLVRARARRRPGIALRLHTTLSTSYFDAPRGTRLDPSAAARSADRGCGAVGASPSCSTCRSSCWSSGSGCARTREDAAEIDAVLEAERAARGTRSDEDTRRRAVVAQRSVDAAASAATGLAPGQSNDPVAVVVAAQWVRRQRGRRRDRAVYMRKLLARAVTVLDAQLGCGRCPTRPR